MRCLHFALFVCLGSLATAPLVEAEPPTFAGEIASIVHANCTECHRTGEAAPFPLSTYDEVRKRGRMIRRVTAERYMPPWMPKEGHGEFHGERRLTEKEIALIDEWVAADMPRGDESKEPAPPSFPKGWRLGEPDLILEMDAAFTVPAEGKDIYRWFALPTGLKESKWLKAVELRPTAPEVVHHVLFFHDNASGSARAEDKRDSRPGFSRRARGASDLGGWAVGSDPVKLPGDLAHALPKGADFLLQVHFHPSGKEQQEKMKVGLYFQDEEPKQRIVTFQVPPQYGILTGLSVPPGETDYRVEDTMTLPEDTVLHGVWGHAHQICTSIRSDATLPDGTKVPLLYIDEWDFNWQGQYQYVDPIELPKGTVIESVITYDNSEDNDANPFHPPQRIKWGEESFDEMGSAIFIATAGEEKKRTTLERGLRMEGLNSAKRFKGQRRIAKVMLLDKDGDGKVSKAETPLLYQRAFGRLDSNKDNFVEEEEIENNGDFLD